MADRKAVNKYYPPDWDPSKGSINKFQNSHPLRERAKKIHLGILVVRFEMPYNTWCLGCDQLIGRGVRFNAEKKHVGDYFSSKIWEFKMNCHECGEEIVVETDPKNTEYEIKKGARRKVEKWEPESVGLPVLLDNEEREREREKMESDPMYKLEHTAKDKKKGEEAIPELTRLIQYKAVHINDWEMNKKMRKRLRKERREIKDLMSESEKKGLNFTLFPRIQEEEDLAKVVEYNEKKQLAAKQKRKLYRLSNSVFGT